VGKKGKGPIESQKTQREGKVGLKKPKKIVTERQGQGLRGKSPAGRWGGHVLEGFTLREVAKKEPLRKLGGKREDSMKKKRAGFCKQVIVKNKTL